MVMIQPLLCIIDGSAHQNRMPAPAQVDALTADEVITLAPYLDLSSVVHGISRLLHHTYGLCLQHRDARPGEVWSDAVMVFDVFDMDAKPDNSNANPGKPATGAGPDPNNRQHVSTSTESANEAVSRSQAVGSATSGDAVTIQEQQPDPQQLLGTLYLDTGAAYGTRMLLYGKSTSIWTSSCTEAEAAAEQTGNAGVPAVAIGLQSKGCLHGHNIMFGLWELLHELGHGLHFLLSSKSAKFIHTAATRLPMELLELPSTIFESFAFHPTCLQVICCHEHTAEPLPAVLAAKWANSLRSRYCCPIQQQQLVRDTS